MQEETHLPLGKVDTDIPVQLAALVAEIQTSGPTVGLPWWITWPF